MTRSLQLAVDQDAALAPWMKMASASMELKEKWGIDGPWQRGACAGAGAGLVAASA